MRGFSFPSSLVRCALLKRSDGLEESSADQGGGIGTPRLIEYQTQCLCKAAVVPYRGEHVFRHTFATNCYHKGVDVKILSRLLGQADVTITYNIYIHLYGDGFDEMYSALVSEK